MTMTRQDREWLDKLEELSLNESEMLEHVFDELFEYAKVHGVKAAGDDRCASLEAAIVRFIIESREG